MIAAVGEATVFVLCVESDPQFVDSRRETLSIAAFWRQQPVPVLFFLNRTRGSTALKCCAGSGSGGAIGSDESIALCYPETGCSTPGRYRFAVCQASKVFILHTVRYRHTSTKGHQIIIVQTNQQSRKQR